MKKTILIILGIVILIPILVFIYFCIAFQSFVMDGQHMEPNISNGELMLVEKNPKEFSRGDIVVFNPPISKSQIYIDRIIATPGEEIDFNNTEQGGFQIKNAQNPNGATFAEPYLSPGTITRGDKDYKVDANNYFVMGDTRNASSDSRVFGEITKENILGKVVFSYKCSNIKLGGTGICVPLNFKKIVVPNYAFSETSPSTNSVWQTYTDPKGRFTFQYPSNWPGVQDKSNSNDTYLSLLDGIIVPLNPNDYNDKLTLFWNTPQAIKVDIQIDIIDNKEDLTIKDYYLKHVMTTGGPGDPKIAGRDTPDVPMTTISGEEAIALPLAITPQAAILEKEILVAHKNEIYNIAYSVCAVNNNSGSCATDDTQWEAIFDKIVSSFKFIN